MSKNIMLVVGVLLIILAGAFFVNMQNAKSNEDSLMGKEDSAKEEKTSDQEMMDEDEDKMMGSESSRYVEYSKATLDSAVANRRVLFFYASWCPTCRPADKSFLENESKIPDDVTVVRVNYNDPETDAEEKELAKKYGITYQHTFVQIDSDGNEVAKWNGGKIDELLTNIK